jgi:hypothetical protein
LPAKEEVFFPELLALASERKIQSFARIVGKLSLFVTFLMEIFKAIFTSVNTASTNASTLTFFQNFTPTQFHDTVKLKEAFMKLKVFGAIICIAPHVHTSSIKITLM